MILDLYAGCSGQPGAQPAAFVPNALLVGGGTGRATRPTEWTHKVCPGCQFIYPRSVYATQSRCRQCRAAYGRTPQRREYRRNYYRRNPADAIAATTRWKAGNRDRVANYARKRKHGISVDQYEVMVAQQRGRCAICDVKPDRDLFVDHNHATGAIRGLLCDKCNRGIGLLQDNPQALRAAADYIEAHRD